MFLVSSTVSPWRELCILYDCLSLQILLNSVLIIVIPIVFGVLVMGKHANNLQSMFRQAGEEMDDEKFNQAVIYHQKLLSLMAYYNSSMRIIFTTFFILQMVLIIILIFALRMVSLIKIS